MESTNTFSVMFEGQEILVKHCQNYVAGLDHFAFHSPHHPRRPIPISSTGYRSHFVSTSEVNARESAKTCAYEILSALLQELSLSPANPDQLSMF